MGSPSSVGNGEDQQEALPRSHVLLSHGTKLLLACRVQDCTAEREHSLYTPLPCPQGVPTPHPLPFTMKPTGTM